MKHPYTILLLLSILIVGCDREEINVPIESMTISQEQLTIATGDSSKLTLTLSPKKASGDIIWTSSNPKVAVVNNGMVSAIARGNSTITATANGISARSYVTVTHIDAPYVLVWSDEFNGPTLDPSVWNIETGGHGWGNQEKQFYTGRPENIRIEDGVLIIEAHKEQYNNNHYTSARINTKGKQAFQYGRIEARISMPSGKGTWPAFWMLGANFDIARWPLCGEIDIVEHVGSDPRVVINATHTSEKNGSNGQNWFSKKHFDNVEHHYNVYAIEWEEKANEGDDCIHFYFNDIKLATVWEPHINATVQRWPFKQDFFIILNLALGGTMGGSIDDTIFDQPVQLKIDYVRVYQRKQ
jgi:beta-glucanase (GH16 family)